LTIVFSQAFGNPGTSIKYLDSSYPIAGAGAPQYKFFLGQFTAPSTYLDTQSESSLPPFFSCSTLLSLFFQLATNGITPLHLSLQLPASM
jgi:hypothetical protein